MFTTPFGVAHHKKNIGKGAIQYILSETPFRSCIKLLDFRNDQIPFDFRSVGGFYSYNDYPVLALCMPELFKGNEVFKEKVIDKFRHKHPDLYERLLGVELLPTFFNSQEKHREEWYKKHEHDWIEIAAWDEWVEYDSETDQKLDITEDHVLIQAAIGGDKERGSSYFLVQKDDYLRNREDYGFIVNPDVHEEMTELEIS